MSTETVFGALQGCLDRVVVIPEVAGAECRNDPVIIEQVSRRRDERGPGQREFALVGQAQDCLHGALSKGGTADHNSAPDVLEGRRDDFGGRCGSAVDQHG